MCTKYSTNPDIDLGDTNFDAVSRIELHPARLLRSSVLFETLSISTSRGRREPHLSNFLEIKNVLWRQNSIPADISTLEAVQRGAFVVEWWLGPLLGLIRTAVLITSDQYHTAGSKSHYHHCTLDTCRVSQYVHVLLHDIRVC